MRFRNSEAGHEYDPGTPGATLQERRALDHLFSVTYEELRRLASTVKRRDPRGTLSPTTLVNEAWLKLADSPHLADTSRLHFKRIAARAMRQVLVEAARRRHAHKRGGGEGPLTVTFDDRCRSGRVVRRGTAGAGHRSRTSWRRMNPRQAMMVESRFFGGLDVTETAALLDVSEATVLRDWRAAKAWLAHELRRAG